MNIITKVITTELHVGDVIDWRGEPREVTALSDTGQPALYGEGNAWHITLTTPAGRAVPMVAAASDKWTRLQELWSNANGALTCLAHGGAYLASAVKNDPAADMHLTPLDCWVKFTVQDLAKMRDEFRARGLPDPACETCAYAQERN